ncbi:16S rRNA methyltransferase [Anopheles sinensis]|uniref:16S rRNA methyltransferase n=1 Tax=Anopheles sinensis TaxID=74873 RepID=A0A084W7J9_ANOSI|nr:16S rRNA methyltransferase [Anopheles sinensis]
MWLKSGPPENGNLVKSFLQKEDRERRRRASALVRAEESSWEERQSSVRLSVRHTVELLPKVVEFMINWQRTSSATTSPLASHLISWKDKQHSSPCCCCISACAASCVK